MADKTLAEFKAGIDRTRQRAVAKAGTFWSLTNCYVTPGGTIAKRPGFRHTARLDEDTKGLFANGGSLRTFFSDGTLTPPSGVNIIYHALRMPTGESLVKVYSDHLFLGKQYVAAEFEGGLIRHYWLQNPTAWSADTQFDVGDITQPSTPNGYYYRASADSPPPAWQPTTAYAVGDAVQPTTYNGFKYTVVEVAGDSPTSGATEPVWPTSDGGQVTEYIDTTPSDGTTPTNPGGTPGGDRYGNLPGYKQQQLGLLP